MMEKKDRDCKKPAPREFVPTELGSAVFAGVEGRPADEEYLITDNQGRDDEPDAAAGSAEDKS